MTLVYSYKYNMNLRFKHIIDTVNILFHLEFIDVRSILVKL